MPTIDGLVDGTTPLAGTEKVPLWQSSDARKVSASEFAGWQYLGSGELAAPNTVLSLPDLATRDMLKVIINITTMATADRPALRFNNDSGTNYAGRVQSGAVMTSGNTVTWTDTDLAASTSALVGQQITNPRSIVVHISNNLGTQKVLAITQGLSGSGTANAAFGLLASHWNNTTARITRVDLVTMAGNSLAAGTGMAVFGRDF